MDDWEASSEENPEPREPIDMPSPSEPPSQAGEDAGGDEGENGAEGQEVENNEGEGNKGQVEVEDTLMDEEYQETLKDVEEKDPELLEDGQGWWNVDKSPSPPPATAVHPSAPVDPSQVETMPFESDATAVDQATGNRSFAPMDVSAIDARIAILQCLSIKFI